MNTNDIAQFIQQLHEAGLHFSGPLAWHGFTAFHGMGVLIIGWLTHANWDKILAAWTWLGQQGGIVGILRTTFFGKKIVNNQPPAAGT